MEHGFLTAQWRYLALLNYQIDPVILEPWVPRGTELDYWEGVCFVSIVGFLFNKTKILGFPALFHRQFEEVNLRFYVRRTLNSETRRGVVFIKEIVPKPLVAFLARWIYQENYMTLPTQHRWESIGENQNQNASVEYSWKFGTHWNRLKINTVGTSILPASGSHEEFITEHYWGYTRQNSGETLEYQVEHPSWRVTKAQDTELKCDVEALYGRDFVEFLSVPPFSAFIAEGSDVVVHRGNKW